MKRLILYSAVLMLLPFVLLIAVNESAHAEEDCKYKGVPVIHSCEAHSEKCSWHCHHNTGYCRQHHVSFMKPYLKVIDPFYSGIINVLASSGNYNLANVIFLVVLWPLLMLTLFMDCVRMYLKLKKNGDERRR